MGSNSEYNLITSEARSHQTLSCDPMNSRPIIQQYRRLAEGLLRKALDAPLEGKQDLVRDEAALTLSATVGHTQGLSALYLFALQHDPSREQPLMVGARALVVIQEFERAFCTRDKNFFWPYTRISCKDVGDLIA